MFYNISVNIVMFVIFSSFYSSDFYEFFLVFRANNSSVPIFISRCPPVSMDLSLQPKELENFHL